MSCSGTSQSMFSAGSEVPRPIKFVPLTSDKWEELKPFLVDLYENQGWKLQQINKWMRDSGYLTTPKMVLNHLNKWGSRRYQSSRDKEAMCQILLDVSAPNRQSLLRDKKQLKKLQRYCKETPEKSESDEAVLKLLRELETESKILNESPEHARAENEENSTEGDQWCMVDRTGEDGVFSTAPTSQSSSQFDGPSSFVGDIVGELDEDATQSNTIHASSDQVFTFIPELLINQPSHFSTKFMAMEKLFHLSQQYYHTKLQEHSILEIQNFSLEPQIGPNSSNLVDSALQNRLFWRKVKSGIYYLKMGSEHLARLELTEAFHLIPLLCEQSPFSLLQDIYATLSPVNTRVSPAVRIDILRAFKQNSVAKLGPNHILSEICRILCAEEGSDELSTTALRAMLDATAQVLSPNQQQLFELQRTLIRLYRRLREFSKAEELSRSLIASQEALHGETHINSRLALTERVYILNDQNRLNEALIAAEDVVQRGQQEQGHMVLDERSIYAMEDVAEICDKLGRINDGIEWLRRASRAALSVWGNHTSTVHISENLEAMHDKRYQQTLCT